MLGTVPLILQQLRKDESERPSTFSRLDVCDSLDGVLDHRRGALRPTLSPAPFRPRRT